jgi:hypothetical protein
MNVEICGTYRHQCALNVKAGKQWPNLDLKLLITAVLTANIYLTGCV